METKNNFRARVMKYAWRICRATGQTWHLCLIKAWQLHRLEEAMKAGMVTFYYTKADGTIRRATGTLRGIPAGATLGGKRVTKPSYKTVTYYDAVKHAFRCFKVENLICAV